MANFFVDKSALNASSARITGEEAKHISRVLRMDRGDTLTLCDGEGTFYDCIISAVHDGAVEADIIAAYPAPTEPKLQITLFQAVPKNPKLEFIVQKATEIGAVRIVPMNTARIVAKLDKESKLERLRKIAFEAAKQSRRGIVPRVEAPLSFEAAVKAAAECDLAVIPYEDERKTSVKEVLRGKAAHTLAVMIGPEGGFDEEEITLALKHGVLPASLGRRILRTETAGLVTAAIALYELGDME